MFMRPLPTGPIVELSQPLPRTAEEAQAFARKMNAAAARRRQAEDAAHEDRQRALAEDGRRAQANAAAEQAARQRRAKPARSAGPARVTTRPGPGDGWAAAIRKAGGAKDLTTSTGTTTLNRGAGRRGR